MLREPRTYTRIYVRLHDGLACEGVGPGMVIIFCSYVSNKELLAHLLRKGRQLIGLLLLRLTLELLTTLEGILKEADLLLLLLPLEVVELRALFDAIALVCLIDFQPLFHLLFLHLLKFSHQHSFFILVLVNTIKQKGYSHESIIRDTCIVIWAGANKVVDDEPDAVGAAVRLLAGGVLGPALFAMPAVPAAGAVQEIEAPPYSQSQSAA